MCLLLMVQCFSLNILEYINSRSISVPHFLKNLQSIHEAPFKSGELYPRAPGNDLCNQKVLNVLSNLPLQGQGLLHSTILSTLLITCFS